MIRNNFLFIRESEKRFFIILMVILSIFFAAAYLFGPASRNSINSKPRESVASEFRQPRLLAKSAYVYDVRTNTVIYAFNENTRMPLASLTKVMSALVATEIAQPYSTVTINQNALTTNGDSGLKTGERWSLKNLLDFSLVSSSNDGIHAVALSLGALASSNATPQQIVGDFVRQMNKKADELDLKNTYYWNDTGLDETEYKGGAYGTTKDMAMLLKYVIETHPEMLEATQDTQSTFTSLDNHEHTAKNTDKVVGDIPGIIASKTGYTDTAGGNLAFVFDPELGRPIIVTILGSTEQGRFEDAKKLVNATLEYLNR